MNENETTEHGNNIASQIEEDFCGQSEYLTIADIHYILDAIHSHFMDTGRDNKFLSIWMEELFNKYPELEVW